MKLAALVSSIALFGTALSHAQQACSHAVQATAADQVIRSQKAVSDYKTVPMVSGIPLGAAPLLVQLKDALVKAADTVVTCYGTETSPDGIVKELSALIHANQPKWKDAEASGNAANEDKPVTGVLGNDLYVSASIVSKQPLLMELEISSSVPCGSDSQELIYEAKDGRWQRALRVSSGMKKSTGQGFIGAPEIIGDFVLTQILPGTSGEWRTVLAHGTPWCTSRFSMFGLSVLAPTENGEGRLIWQTARSFSRGDFVTKLKATADGFELRLNAPAFDTDEFERTVVYRYKVAGDVVKRVGPIATNGRGFVEEWLEMPWNEALGVTSLENATELKAVHERRVKADKDSKTYISFTNGPVRTCSVKGRFEVEMDADPGGKQFFAIQEGSSGYTMVNFGTTQDERCGGRH